jgi:hypothetical protein
MVMPGGSQFQYDSPVAKKVRAGEPASRGDDLKENPPAFNPKDFRTAFIKNSRTNPLDRVGFDDPEPIISEARKIGVTPNFGDFNNTLDPKSFENQIAQGFLDKYIQGSNVGLIQQPVDTNAIGRIIGESAPYQSGSFNTGETAGRAGSSGIKVG